VSVSPDRDRLRQLPSVDELIRVAEGAGWAAQYPRALLVGELRRAVSTAREEIRAGRAVDVGEEALAAAARRALTALAARTSLRRVINASGVVLHTNLGRAPLSTGALEAAVAASSGYSNLEYDLNAGRRGKRDAHLDELFERLLGAPAIVVNNNAAAIFLALNELSGGGETLVSRGELVEIGDGFRIPEILERSGAILCEVGATNRTSLEDYCAAVGPETRAVLRVHRSNFEIVGFTAQPSLAELVGFARNSSLPLIEDLGAGRLDACVCEAIAAEPSATASIAAGVDLVTFSGDKLLGGPQAGIIAGKPELVRRLRRNPLFRALRVDKLITAALEATLRDLLLGRAEHIPALRMLSTPRAELRRRAEIFLAGLKLPLGFSAALESGESLVGGGAGPERRMPTALVAIRGPLAVSEIEKNLRASAPPVVARIEEDHLLFDLRTVLPDEEAELAVAIEAACAGL